jgi:hypothetical protein
VTGIIEAADGIAAGCARDVGSCNRVRSGRVLRCSISSEKFVEGPDAKGELGLIVRCMVFDGECQTFCECELLVESTYSREHERGRIQDDVVAHPVRVRVGDETVV